MPTIQSRFEEFHKNNPHVYDLILKYVKQVVDAGYKNYSINGIFEQIRWHTNIVTKDREFKLSNDYRSRYVRLFEQNNPKWIGFFRTRELTSK